MRMSQLFTKTRREVPAEAETASHQFLLRAGMIYQVAAGTYSLLPLAWRSVRKIEQIIREEMDAAGGQEILMPALQPVELWEQSGRARTVDVLFVLEDRKQHRLVLAPTHEEVVTSIARQNVQSYRDLPFITYQIQTKFRDEPRPRAGLIRVREFTMKDAYSFDADEAGLAVSYDKMVQAYKNIFDRCGVPWVMIEADSGAIGGKASNEFMLIAETGEDRILICEHGDYAANVERAVFQKPDPLIIEPPAPLEAVHTPGQKTIADLVSYLELGDARETLKAVFYHADGEIVFVVIRGDLDVNEIKLKNALHAIDLRLATDEEVRAAGLVAGSASPVGLTIKTVADESVQLGSNFVAGANRPDWHLRNVNYGRDFTADILTDIAEARPGDRCLRDGGALGEQRGIEVGHVFKLGTVYSDAFNAVYLDKEGMQRPIQMGCYGIGSGRLMAAVVEQNHDDKGIIWPVSIAPYQVHLTALGMDNPAVASAAEQLYGNLQAAGLEVLLDDRQETPGVKFNDADLLGMPLRITVSARTLKQSSAEFKRRTEKEFTLVPLGEAVARAREVLFG